MYYLVVVTTMLILPALSIVVDARGFGTPLDLLLVGKWFTFWAVGVRLSLAGLRQIIQPGYTARVVLGLKGTESLVLVRELGFANLAIGSIGLLSLALPQWTPAAALAGGIFYVLAGLNHVFQARRNRLENIAMISDLIASAVLLSAVIAVGLQDRG